MAGEPIPPPPPPPDSSASEPAGTAPSEARRTTLGGVDSPTTEFRRGLVGLATGTRPGLERFLLASVPALTLGAVGAAFFGRIAGLVAGLLTLAVVMLMARRVGGEE